MKIYSIGFGNNYRADNIFYSKEIVGKNFGGTLILEACSKLYAILSNIGSENAAPKIEIHAGISLIYPIGMVILGYPAIAADEVR